MGQPWTTATWEPGPERLEPPADEAHLWLLGAAANSLDSKAALRGVLGRYLGDEPGAIRIERPTGGKPRLAERPERLRFNLSHSGSLLLIGVATVEIGVDVQTVDPRRPHLAIAERRLSPQASAAVRGASEAGRPAVFAAEWALFEARQKCRGLGVFAAADGPPPPAANVEVAPGYAAAIAVESGRLPNVRRFLLSG